MKRRQFNSLPLLVSFLTLTSTALASTTWYVDGSTGSDSNNCMSPETACKTIGHAISLASSGDSIIVAAAIYTENLTIGLSVNVIGSGASTTIIDGGGVNTVVTISTASVVTLSQLTIRNGNASNGGGISNDGVLTINNSTVSGNVAACGRNPCVGFGGGIHNAPGMYPYQAGEVLLNNSTLNGNKAYAHFAYSQGGGINNLGIVVISNSTLSGNGAGHGGGIFGGAVFQNSIVANSGGGNCNRTMSTRGYNLSSDSTCNFNAWQRYL